MHLKHSTLLLIVGTALIGSGIIELVHGNATSTLNLEEAQALQKLRPLVEAKLPKEYMKEDRYLVRFLRARKLNVQNAADMISKTMTWRKENRIDEIVNEVIGVEKSLPFTLGSFDRSSRPVGVLKLGSWKARRVVIAGERDKLKRAIQKFLESLAQGVRTHGKNVTQGYIIMDLSNFNARENACLQCVTVGTDMFTIYENYYPQFVYKIVGVNTPRVFETLFNIYKPIMSQATKEIIFIYGHDKNAWREALLEDISNDQIPTYLGGTYVENLATRIKTEPEL